MAESFIDWTGAKSEGDLLSVPGFLSREHITVLVDNVEVSGSLWEWVSDGQIRVLVGFPSGSSGRAQRTTPTSEDELNQLTNDGAYDADAVNANDRRLLYIMQEAREAGTLAFEARDEALVAVVQTAQDVVSTAADVVSTNADAVATAAARVQTGLDVAATAVDVISADADRVAAEAAASAAAISETNAANSETNTGDDAVQTAADRVQTGADVIASVAAKDAAEIARDEAVAASPPFPIDQVLGLQGELDGKLEISDLPGPTPAFRNLIANGDMQINQEGDKTGVGHGAFGCDLADIAVVGSALYDLTQVLDGPPGLGNCLEVKVSTANASLAAGDVTILNWRLEGRMLQHVKKGLADARPLTFDIQTKTNKAGTYPVELFDHDNNRSVQSSVTLSGSGAWETLPPITFPADTTGAFDNDSARSMSLILWLSAGTDFTSGTASSSWAANFNPNRATDLSVNFADTVGNYMRITGVQLEVGDTATEFEHLPYDVQLQRVQKRLSYTRANIRYYSPASSRYQESYIYWPVEMAGIPSATIVANGSVLLLSSIEVTDAQKVGCRFRALSSGVGDAYSIGTIVKADARL